MGPILYCVYVKSTITILSMSAVYTNITCVKTYNFFAALFVCMHGFDPPMLCECMALWGKPNEPCIQHHVYIYIQYVDS